MDVFGIHRQLITEYDAFTTSLVRVRDQDIQRHLDDERERKARWPDPWLSLNPSFRGGGTVAELAHPDVGLLHPACADHYFRVKHDPDDPGERTLTLHQHQREAIEAAASGDSYVVTTGTGSGKSLTYIVPIVDAVLRNPNPQGISAIVVYPMNALANSQLHELQRYLEWGVPASERRVTFARYTGQERRDQRVTVLRDKPDILLTNYMMLEYLLTRPEERRELIGAAQGLRFLALDELHTYRGRQGADVALLVRRLRDACAAPGLTCIGTSATMATASTFAEASKVVAQVATRLFGTGIPPHRVIGETLERSTDPGPQRPAAAVKKALTVAVRRAAHTPAALPREYEALAADPLAVWIEDTFGLDKEKRGPNGPTKEEGASGLAEGQGTGRLVRRDPTTIPRAAVRLAEETGQPPEDCQRAIRVVLDAGAAVRHPQIRDRPLFAFRLHQFLSKGDTVYASLDPAPARHLTSQYQVSVPEARHKPLVPLAFCRECGHEYLVVTRETHGGERRFIARPDPDAPAADGDGYLYTSDDRPWPADREEVLARLPETWVETGDDGARTVVGQRSGDLPTEVWVAPDGAETTPGEGLRAWWIAAPFRFCLRCRVSYEQLRVRDFAKLATFSAEGRSSAVSLISSSVVRSLRGQEELDARARKLLTFVDNRQDASLQAGHFNDFSQVTQVRGALYRALAKAGDGGLRHDALPAAVSDTLGLRVEAFAQSPGARYRAREDALSALRSALAYRVYADLERGWRLTMPNLSQTGLLRFDYLDLADICADQECWDGAHPVLAGDTPAHREEIARCLLDELRRALAVDEPLLTKDGHDRLVRQSGQHLTGVWAIPEREPRAFSRTAHPGRGPRGAPSADAVYLSGLGAYGRYLRRPGQFAAIPGLAGRRLPVADADAVIRDLLAVLKDCGLVTVALDEPDHPRARAASCTADPGTAPGYQIRSSTLVWLPGDGGTPEPDPVRKVTDPGAGGRVNTFFRDLYRDAADQLAGLVAREHTAQVPADLRMERESAFREGDLKLMYCSPTMELGVDIATLNAVAMRNVPPTPANYAQRSGRAGRSGQPALVTTYCSTGSAHDQYYFRRSHLMVSGSVSPPRLDLANENLLRSHVHAIWLAETGAHLGSRMTDVLDAETPAATGGPAAGPAPLPLRPALRRQLGSDAARRRAVDRATAVLAPLTDDLRRRTTWWYDGWIEDTVRDAPTAFDDACDRWRRLYRSATAEREEQHRIAGDLSVTPRDRVRAQARRAEAENQRKLLCNEDSEEAFSDFYTYRYLASEGFLPGYSFPRLPLAAYVKGQREAGSLGQHRGAYIQRPRFIAVSEFGPGALIYHEGHRYAVDRVQVPVGDSPGQVATTDAKVCPACGYWHDRKRGADTCDQCGAALVEVLNRLMPLSTVYASPRRRISSDEEERLRAGFELRTAYRFSTGRSQCGRLGATVVPRTPAGGAGTVGPLLAELAYGDSAEVRVINLGYRKRKNPSERGFWLDPVRGRWLSASRAAALDESAAEDEALGSFATAERTLQVIPFVEDSKNIAVLRLAEPVEADVAVTLRYALERGIEAHYQLEDAELGSEDLPDAEGRGRMLFIEGAEGGAGVLRLLHDDEDALAAVARKALEIIHVAPDGRDLHHAEGARERCERGCYDCLLSYANQRHHRAIDRMRAVPVLMALAAGRTVPDRPGEPTPRRAAALADRTRHEDGGGFVAWLRAHGHRLPDEAATEVPDAQATPDFVYRLPGADVAVFLDGPAAPGTGRADAPGRDARAEDRLTDLGWLVIRVNAVDAVDAADSTDSTEEWSHTVRQYPNVFGEGRSTR